MLSNLSRSRELLNLNNRWRNDLLLVLMLLLLKIDLLQLLMLLNIWLLRINFTLFYDILQLGQSDSLRQSRYQPAQVIILINNRWRSDILLLSLETLLILI